MDPTHTETEPRPAPRGRLLILNVGRIGDTILRNSILASAYRTFAAVDYLCGKNNAEIVRAEWLRPGAPLQQLTVLRNTVAGFADVLRTAFRRRYDALIDLKGHPSTTSLLLASLCRSRVKTGANRGLLRPFHRDVRRVTEPGLHLLETMRRIGRLAGLVEAEYRPTMVLPPDSSEWFRQQYPAFQRPFLLLNISATHPVREWSLENWVRYVNGCGLAGQPMLINGSPHHRDRVRELARRLPGAEAFQPRCFMDVAAAIKAARLVLTVDTGVVHVCSVFDVPLVALYWVHHTSPGYLPLSTWQLVIRPTRGYTVMDITPEQAIAESQARNVRALL
jgi:ADP-heptose:LPS heptosyltransferase